jgi:hypothetical protein
VATNGADAVAGSNSNNLGMNGSIDPIIEPNVTMATNASRQRPVRALPQ